MFHPCGWASVGKNNDLHHIIVFARKNSLKIVPDVIKMQDFDKHQNEALQFTTF